MGTQLNDEAGNAEVPAVVVTGLTTPQDLRTSDARIYAWTFYNPNDEPIFLEFFNSLATNVTLGTTIPVVIVPIPAQKISNLSVALPIKGFGTAISAAAVIAPNGSTVPTVGATGSVVLTTN